jgi:hypothetical protein
MNGLLGKHSFTIDRYGDWTLDGRSFYLDLRDIDHLLTEDRLKELSFDDIAFKGKHFTSLRGPTCLCCDGARYHAAQTKFPCIVVEGMVNPYGCKYRMIDGKHRLEKMINAGETSALFYVLQVSDLP